MQRFWTVIFQKVGLIEKQNAIVNGCSLVFVLVLFCPGVSPVHEHVELEVLLLGEPGAAHVAGELHVLARGRGGLLEVRLRHQLPVLQRVQTLLHRLLDVVLQVLDQLGPGLVPGGALPRPRLAL